jgi:flagellar hook-length control protein FliK
MNLSQQGVQVAEFTVDVQQDNSGQQHNPQQQEQGMLNFGGMTDDDETEEFRVDLEEGLLWWVA